MPELFIRCSTCEGKPLIPVAKGEHTIKENTTCSNSFCERGFVRYGQEPGHQHQWITWCYPSDLFPGEHIVMSKERFFQVPWMAEPEQHQTVVKTAMFCTCGKTAAEVTPDA